MFSMWRHSNDYAWPSTALTTASVLIAQNWSRFFWSTFIYVAALLVMFCWSTDFNQIGVEILRDPFNIVWVNS